VDLRDLEAFVAVAEELHFGRAAARLHISQPPLSLRIRQLEADLGVTLFDRTTRAVALTPGGARLLPSAQQALIQVGLTRQVAESIRSGDRGLVRVGFAGASSQRALPLLSRAVREEYPGIELELHSQTYVFTALQMLVEGRLDLAFARLPSQHPALASRVVEVEQLLCAVPDTHPLAQRHVISMSDLIDEEFVSLPDDQGSILQATMVALCVTAGFRPRVTQFAPDSVTVLALVSAGVGVTITLSSVAPAQTAGVVYLPIEGIDPSHMFATLAWRESDPSLALRRVLDVAARVLPTPDLSGFANNPFIKGIRQL
jgi:DNA-binding transcriptional LysR family regulator